MALRLIRDLVRGQVLLTCRPEATVAEVARQMAERSVGAILVMVEERLAGIFTERDALVRMIAAGRDPATTAVGEVMTRAVNTISPDRPVLHALHEMHENNFRHVPVAENDRPIGIRFDPGCARRRVDRARARARGQAGNPGNPLKRRRPRAPRHSP